jgi:hypothetical protein
LANRREDIVVDFIEKKSMIRSIRRFQNLAKVIGESKIVTSIAAQNQSQEFKYLNIIFLRKISQSAEALNEQKLLFVITIL